jgi:hypothetical protein
MPSSKSSLTTASKDAAHGLPISCPEMELLGFANSHGDFRSMSTKLSTVAKQPKPTRAK